MDELEETQVLKNFSEDFFGELAPFIADIDITDISCNGRDVWLNHVKKGRYKADIEFKENDIKNLAYKISNTENVQFNKVSPTLQADLHDLRFQFTHDSFSVSGTTVSIRKTPVVVRIQDDDMKQNKVEYLTEKGIAFFNACIKSRLNTIVCGMTGSGKTEFVKYLIKFAEDYERIITIEDTLELHLAEIYKNKDVVELKVNDHIDYDGAIRSCMRMLPIWVLLSESRGKEVKELLKCISTGAKIISTIHVDNARQIPSRLLNMFEDNELSNDKIEKMIHDYLDIGVHVKAKIENGLTIRYIDQIVYFEVDSNGQHMSTEIFNVQKQGDHYVYHYYPLPESLRNHLQNNDFILDWEEIPHE